MITVVLTQEHNQCPIEAESAIILSNAKICAKNSHDTPRTTVNECLTGLTDAAIIKLLKIFSIEKKS